MDKLNFTAIQSEQMPDEYFRHTIDARKSEIALELLRGIKDGEARAFRYKETIDPPMAYGEKRRITITVHPVEVKQTHLEIKPIVTLTFWQRLRVLFTGQYPHDIRRA